jgi:hypothetical protein
MNLIGSYQQEVAPLRDTAWAMKLFGYSPKRKAAWCEWYRNNDVPYVRIGRRILFSERDVMEYIASRSCMGRAEKGAK